MWYFIHLYAVPAHCYVITWRQMMTEVVSGVLSGMELNLCQNLTFIIQRTGLLLVFSNQWSSAFSFSSVFSIQLYMQFSSTFSILQHSAFSIIVASSTSCLHHILLAGSYSIPRVKYSVPIKNWRAHWCSHKLFNMQFAVLTTFTYRCTHKSLRFIAAQHAYVQSIQHTACSVEDLWWL